GQTGEKPGQEPKSATCRVTRKMRTYTPGLGPQHNWHFLTDLSPKCRLRHFSEKAVGVVPRSKLLRVTALRSAAYPADGDRACRLDRLVVRSASLPRRRQARVFP